MTSPDRRPPQPAMPGEALSLEDVFSAVEAAVALVESRSGAGGGRPVLEGPNIVLPGYRRLFGGQLLAQAIAAAAGGAQGLAGKVVRSLHLVFVAEGRLALPVSWSVEAVHDGRTFATRSVVARQGERLLATGVVSLHTPDVGGGVLEHSIGHVVVPPPREVAAVDQIGAMAFETRPLLPPNPNHRGGGAPSPALDGFEVGPPELAVWLRAPRVPCAVGGGPAGAELRHQELLAYASDLTMMVAALRPHEGIGYGSPLVTASAVTSHTISFHRAVRVDEWLLFVQESPAAAAGRAYIRGDFFDDAGTVVASCAQEALIRVASADGS